MQYFARFLSLVVADGCFREACRLDKTGASNADILTSEEMDGFAKMYEADYLDSEYWSLFGI